MIGNHIPLLTTTPDRSGKVAKKFFSCACLCLPSILISRLNKGGSSGSLLALRARVVGISNQKGSPSCIVL